MSGAGYTPPESVDLSREAEAVLGKIASCFGLGITNGVAAILYRDDLPEQFDREDWAGWSFHPAESAFELAHDWGLIAPWKLSNKWVFTPLGVNAGALFRKRAQGERIAPEGGAQ